MTFFKRAKNAHKHEFREVYPKAMAFYGQKRNRAALWFEGAVRQCPYCGQYRFQIPGLSEVEVEIT